MSPSLRNILLFIVIGGLMVAGYLYFFSGGDTEPALIAAPGTALVPEDTSGTLPSASQDFLSVLLSVKGVKLDDAILSDPAFATLRDSSIVLTQDGTEGRPNPFAPIGFEGVTPPSIPVNIPVNQDVSNTSTPTGVTGGTDPLDLPPPPPVKPTTPVKKTTTTKKN